MRPTLLQHISPTSQLRRLRFALVMSLLLVYAGDVTLRESKAQLANTQIVFETLIGVVPNWEIYVINADGTNHVRLTHHPSTDRWPCWSPDGTKIAFASTRDGDSDIYMMNSDGTGVVNLTNHPRSPDSMPSWSPDGTKIAFESWRDFNQPEIYVMNADGTHPVNLTFHLQRDSMPSWSPDGTKIAFVSRRTRFDADIPLNNEIYVMNADDGADLTRLTFSPFTDWFPSWSPDGTKIAFMSSRDENFEIYVMNADGTNPVNLTNHPSGDGHPSWSPDGTKIAFDSRRGNNGEIYVMNADGTHQVRLTSNRVSDLSPSWSPIFPPFAATSPREKRLTLWGQIKVLFRKE